MDIRETNRRVIEQFRAGGEIEGMHRDRLVLLTTVGVRTGRQYTRPMMFHRDGDRILVVASNAGAPTDPDWYRNLLREPVVTVEVGDDTYEAVASGAGRRRPRGVMGDADIGLPFPRRPRGEGRPGYPGGSTHQASLRAVRTA
jgi:deazaflavin-dependent oxidoreductase (nitroreductase family)